MINTALPGAELIEQGLGDLVRGVESIESLLVSIGAPRLRTLGHAIPRVVDDPELRLYALLATEFGDGTGAVPVSIH